jgi:hypothetical protein
VRSPWPQDSERCSGAPSALATLRSRSWCRRRVATSPHGSGGRP